MTYIPYNIPYNIYYLQLIIKYKMNKIYINSV